MKRVLILGLLALATSASAQVPARFYDALWHVETGGRQGAVVGDGGKALGPYQIHRAYWQDSGVPGSYGMVTNEAYARRVVAAYLQRYAPRAVASGDLETLARTHSGGPSGASKPATLGYWRKVKARL